MVIFVYAHSENLYFLRGDNVFDEKGKVSVSADACQMPAARAGGRISRYSIFYLIIITIFGNRSCRKRLFSFSKAGRPAGIQGGRKHLPP